MSTPAVINNNNEHISAACLLSLAGGFLDVYSYLFRGEVFANAVTGNMVFCGLHMASGEWNQCIKYVVAIVAYACGVLVSELLRHKISCAHKIGWHQTILFLEICCLSFIIFIPKGELDYLVNALIAFVCAMQVETFRRVNGLPFASTMCTGNLRSSSEALFKYLLYKDKKELNKVYHYGAIIGCFIAGASGAAVLLKTYGEPIFFLAPACLTLVLFMMTTRRQLGSLRQKLRSLTKSTNKKTFLGPAIHTILFRSRTMSNSDSAATENRDDKNGSI
ncbi:MAG: YoaK family protein [Candidatus Bruticola sp.]